MNDFIADFIDINNVIADNFIGMNDMFVNNNVDINVKFAGVFNKPVGPPI